MVAALMVVLVLVASFVVDLGMQRVLRRDLQSMADVVALDLSRLVDGRSAAAIIAGDGTHPALAAARDASVARNPSTMGGTPQVEAALVVLKLDGTLETDASGAARHLTGTEIPNAVWVRSSGVVNFAFRSGTGGASRTAVAGSDAAACLQVGSFAAALSTGNSAVLGRYLGEALGITGVGYDGLATSRVRLGALSAALGVGTTTSIVDLQHLQVARLLTASATALAADGGQQANVTLLGSIAAKVSQTLTVDLTKVVDLTSGSAAVLAGTINVLDLVAISAFVANGDHLLDLPVLWSVPQFSEGSTSLTVIEGPQRACGRINQTVASTAQIRMAANPKLNVPTIAGLAADPVSVDLNIALAGATATLTSVTCGAGTAASPQVIGARISRQLSTMTLNVPIRLRGDVKASNLILGNALSGLLGLLGLNTKATFDITIQAGVSVTSPPTVSDATYSVPPHDWTDPEHVGGTGGMLLPHVSIDGTDVSGTVTVSPGLGLLPRTLDFANLTLGVDFTLAPILTDLVSKNVLVGVDAFIDKVNEQVNPLTQLLGIQLAGADLFGVEAPGCNTPALHG
ncbi:hypothetical protein BH11ACT8_BH11ACT8_10360 [soil metagenome]